MLIEWPKGSGRVADYTEEEHAHVRAMVPEAVELGIPAGQIVREFGVLHELKVELDARLVLDEPPLLPYRPPPDSLFQYPMAVARALFPDAALGAQHQVGERERAE